MYKIKDFLYMNVYSFDGKKYGFIKDVIIDLNRKVVNGFEISVSKMGNKKSVVLSEDIIAFSEDMITTRISTGNYFSFSQIRGIDTLDINGNILGMVSDIIFDIKDFHISAIIISTGIFKDISSGRKILIPELTILGDENLIYIDDKKNIQFVSNAHKLYFEDEGKNEK